jgi:hypothetical protein
MKILSYCTSFFLLLFLLNTSLAQEDRFFIPQEIKQAYEKGTRSYDGQPGPNYWQNTVDYQIEVEVFPAEKKLAGTESITYYNNSPGELDVLVIRLYHDAFRKANARANRVNPDDITEGVMIDSLSVDGNKLNVSNPQLVRRQGTNLIVQLPQPIESGGNINVGIAWSQQIPVTTIRTGAYDETSFFLAYWYPQVAVYDDVFGWDLLSYDFSTEFYNNLGNYDVTIKAPSNFTVLSTGELQNAQEILSAEHLERYQKAKTATEKVQIISPEDLEAGVKHSSDSWHYTASEVADFAFCLSDHYCWDAASQKVEDRQVLISSYYPARIAQQAEMVTSNQQKMMKHFSEDIPGIPYPYPEFTTFIQGIPGGGMEYPMMANNGGPGLGVTVHEMFHTYFPMYVRVNEKRFAWMDEGWADFTTSFLIRRFFEEDEEMPLYTAVSAGVQGTLGTISDLPLITSTQFMDNTNYGYASYPLPAFLYAVLYDHLGEELFLDCWREYIRRWAKKSPTPYDFFYTFEDVSGQDLSWFWKPWFFNFGSVDVDIVSFENGQLVLENKGNRPVPILLQKTYKDGMEKMEDYSAERWKDNAIITLDIADQDKIEFLSVNAGVPDMDMLNNFYPSLQERFEGFSITEDILGRYRLNEYPIDLTISKEEGLLLMDISAAGMRTYLMPKSELLFESVSGDIKVTFRKEEGKYTGMTLDVGGMQRVTAEKQ